ncbi:L-aspartate oxidase [Roseburia sp. 499]|uniref:L-aspartate oxidase n=1 Tax=Roseburia sp. 499 TaxID=1261634 RepID=UPI0009531418|nr:L-aspartate oxidase [Roseburia sp. 499]WVK70929.1 L-aspartate oxidase [Roseburia sp. 499]
MERETDVIIVGTGAAGLFCALQFPEDKRITVITKEDAESSDSFLAQGGMCMLRSEEDFDGYFEDTMKAGHYKNNKASVEVMIRSSQHIAQKLIGYGVDFERKNGELAFTREGGHSRPRILFHEDITGKEITGTLLERVKERKNIKLYEHTTMLDILCKDNVCYGLVVQLPDGKVDILTAPNTVLACGGIGGLYRHSTNFPHITGDAIAIALRHKITLQDVNYVQIHPTTLYSEKPGRSFLISESVRGEGALLYNAKMERFVDELLPRDIVTAAINKQMAEDGKPYVWLSMAPIAKEDILSHFPNIYKRCLEEGYDVTKECIPVVPGQHYFMGGIQSDLEGRTSMRHLYAVGETCCNGVHGANRLASNSLLESLVFAERAAQDVLKQTEIPENENIEELFEPGRYVNLNEFNKENKQMVRQEIERMKEEYEQHNHDIKCG